MRISSLPELVACPGWWLLRRRETDRKVGPAADTGSAVGRAIELYHNGHPPREARALAFSKETVAERYPKATLVRAGRLAESYMKDPRNRPATIASDCEREVTYENHDFHLVGHVDQIRDGAVWDVKAGLRYCGSEMLAVHAPQLAGYALAGRWTIGGIIRVADYEEGGPVFYHATYQRAFDVLRTVMREVDRLREGDVDVRPGPHCLWCPGGNIGDCMERLHFEPPRKEEVK